MPIIIIDANNNNANQRSIGADEATVVALPKTQAVRLSTIIISMFIVMMI